MNKKLYLSPETICQELSIEGCFCQSNTQVTTEDVGELEDLFGEE